MSPPAAPPAFPGSTIPLKPWTDRHGQVSFALVAVLILLLAGASFLAYGEAGDHARKMQERSGSVQRMAQCGSALAPEIEELAYRAAVTACQGPEVVDTSLLQSRFEQEWAAGLSSNYPLERSGLELAVAGSDLHLEVLRLCSSPQIGRIGSTDPISWEGEGLPAYLTVQGNYTILVSQGQDRLLLERSVEKRLYIPLPLLLDRLRAFDSAVTGGKCDLENMVRYELASLLQLRTLQGGGAFSIDGPMGTDSLLDEEDVRRAVGLSIVLLELECFGSLDPASASQVLAEFPVALSCDELQASLPQGGHVDPADLFLRLMGAHELDLRLLMSQSIYSTIDVLVLRWLDYMGILSLAQGLELLATEGLATLNEVLERLLGEDRILENVVEWMTIRLLEAGFPEDSYRWLNYAPADAEIELPSLELEVRGRDGAPMTLRLGGRHDLDFPSQDLMANDLWKDFIVDYRTGTCELAQAMQSFLRDLSLQVYMDSDLPPLDLVLDPLDDLCFCDELRSGVERAIEEGRALDEVIQRASLSSQVKDPVGQALVGYVTSEWRNIFQLEQSLDYALEGLASDLIHGELDGIDQFDEVMIEGYIGMLAHQLKAPQPLGVRSLTEDRFLVRVEKRLEIFSQAFGNLSLDRSESCLGSLLASLAQGLIQGVPGAEAAMGKACLRMLEDAREASGLRSDPMRVVIAQPEMVLCLGQGQYCRERLLPVLDIPWLRQPCLLSVDLVRPQCPDDGPECEGLHMVEPGNLSFSAYQSEFRARVGAEVVLGLRASGDLSGIYFQGYPCSVRRSMELAFECTLSCSSAWPLQGVSYQPSTTLLGEASAVFSRIWDGVVMALQGLSKVASEVFDFLKDLVTKLITYSMKLVQALSDLLMSLVQGLRDLIDGALGAFIAWLGRMVVESVGVGVFALEFGGLHVLFETGLSSIFFGRSKEYLRVTMSMDLLGASLCVQARFVDIYREGPDLIANISMVGEGWCAECLIDPRMMVMDHFVELRGAFPEYVVELQLPVLVAYEKRSFRLSDIPGLGQLLSRIPVPIPGLTASLDAGFELKYDRPFALHPVVNEVEMNPAGPDQGQEWAELYNPSNSPVDLSGWTLRTSHGDQGCLELEGLVLGAKKSLLVRFPHRILDNGGEAGYPLGESLSLFDAQGRKVDSMPYLSDHLNDAQTWQRAFDASDRWEFREGTPGTANSLALTDFNDMDRFLRSLMDCAARAFARMGDAPFDMASLAELIKSTIEEAVGSLLEMLARSIVEMSLFMEVALQDYSQTVDGRIRLALAVTGEGVRDALLWMGEAVLTALNNLLSPGAMATRAHSIHGLLDDVYVRFGAFASVGLPKLLSDAGAGGRFLFGGLVDINLATFVAPPGGSRNWAVNFGALFEGVPGALLRQACAADADQLVDCWLIRGSVHSPRPAESESIDPWG